jgi:hypothetical protein
MPTMPWASGARLLVAACMLVCTNVYAQTAAPLLNQVNTVAAATQGVPVQETVDITAAGTYEVTLTDLGAELSPTAPLASVELAISTGSALVNLAAVSGSTGTVTGNTQLTGAGSVTFTASAAGTYVIHVAGVPGTVAGSGAIGLQVTNTANKSQVAAFSATLALPSTGTPSDVASLNDTFTVPAAGSYVVTLTDMQLPAALTTLTMVIVPEGGSPVTNSILATAAGTPVVSATVSLQAGTTYGIFAGGQAGGTVNAGLYGVNVVPAAGGAPVYGKTVPVGSVTSVGTPTLTAANYALSVADLAFPTALSQVGAAVTQNGLSLAQLTATGSTNSFAATASVYQVFAVGIPASGSQGSYSVAVQTAGVAPVLSLARAVSDPASGIYAYSFDTTTVGSETYALALADFGYPASFSTIKATAVQSGALVGASLSAAGSLNITPAAGAISLLVFAQPAPAASSTASTGGLFGIDLTANGAATPAFETSQGVGQLFSVQTVTITTGGSYQVVVADLAFPATFANLAVIVTRGTSEIGSIFGGGTLPFTATGGTYLINFVAQPSGTAQAGTYSLAVGEAPPAATATLQASPTSVSSGGTVTLTWSSTNTTSCTASSSPAGVWSGTLATSGTATSAALTAATTFTVTCAGTDGTSPTQSAAVTITSSSSSGGGGGTISADVLALLLGLLLLRKMVSPRTDHRVSEGQCH